MPAKPSRKIEIPAHILPVAADADVVVIGGGAAGVSAAIAAARTGARVILIERCGYLSGGLSAAHTTRPGPFGDSDGRQVIRGVGWEFIERMERGGAARVNRQSWEVEIWPETAPATALEMVAEADVDLYLRAWASEPVVEYGLIHGVVVQDRAGRRVINGKAFVDATGEAMIAHLAGAPTDATPPGGAWEAVLTLTVCNVDAAQAMQWAEKHTDAPLPFQPTLLPGVYRFHAGLTLPDVEAQTLARAEIEAHKQAMEQLARLRETIPGFARAVVVGASSLAVHESRRIVGEYVLTCENLLHNARFPDVIALNAPAHLQGNHDIPLRALIPRRVENLLVAGRAISAEAEAAPSLRGAAACMATGHAAGVAAALAARGNGRTCDVDVYALQETLKAQDAILSIV